MQALYAGVNMKLSIKDLAMIFVGFYFGSVFLSVAADQELTLNQVLNSLVPFISTAGAVAAILAVIQVSYNSSVEREYKRTHAEVEEIKEQIILIRDCLLKDGKPKNVRVEWIQAAHSILSVNQLVDNVEVCSEKYDFTELSSKANRLVSELSTELYKTMCIKSDNLSGSLPEQFFYGVADYTNKSLEEVKLESEKLESIVYDYKEVPPPWGITKLDHRSVFIVVKFIAKERLVVNYGDIVIEPLMYLGVLEGFSNYLENSI